MVEYFLHKARISAVSLGTPVVATGSLDKSLSYSADIAAKAGLREHLPYAIHINRRVVIKVIADVRVGGVGNARRDLSVGILSSGRHKMGDVEIDAGVGRIYAMHHFQADVGAFETPP